jgi:hypothetical protein
MPRGASASDLRADAELGIPEVTLCKWRRQAR